MFWFKRSLERNCGFDWPRDKTKIITCYLLNYQQARQTAIYPLIRYYIRLVLSLAWESIHLATLNKLKRSLKVHKKPTLIVALKKKFRSCLQDFQMQHFPRGKKEANRIKSIHNSWSIPHLCFACIFSRIGGNTKQTEKLAFFSLVDCDFSSRGSMK